MEGGELRHSPYVTGTLYLFFHNVLLYNSFLSVLINPNLTNVQICCHHNIILYFPRAIFKAVTIPSAKGNLKIVQAQGLQEQTRLC